MTRALRPSSVLAGALAAVLLLGACSSDAEPASERSSSAPSPDAATSAATPPRPVAFGFAGAEPGRDGGDGTTSIRFGCTRYVDHLVYEQLTVDTPVVLRAIRSDGLEVGRTWISDDRRQRLSSGVIAPDAPGARLTDEPGWRDRTRLAGARLAELTGVERHDVALGLGSGWLPAVDAIAEHAGAEQVVEIETTDWPYAMDRVRRCR